MAETLDDVGAIILAAGQSTRMGKPKLLLPLSDKPVIRHVTEAAIVAGIAQVVIVTGPHSEAIAEAVRGLAVQLVPNPDFVAGEMLSSIQIGLRAMPDDVNGALIMLGDQPSVPSTTIRALADVLRNGGCICQPTYGGRRGHPIGIARRYWGEILGLGRDQSLRTFMNRHRDEVVLIPSQDAGVLEDMDTPEDYRRMLERWTARASKGEETGHA
ncbi:MAG: hypothetical protein Kow0047_29810 [Anaerolineae bacterium]